MLIRVFTVALAVFISSCGQLNQKSLEDAQLAFAENDRNTALIITRSLLQTNPNDNEARTLQANIELAMGDYQAAEKNFRRVLEFNSNSFEFWNEYLQSKALLESSNEVVDLYRSGISLDDKGKAFALYSALNVGDLQLTQEILNSLEDTSSSYALLAKAYFTMHQGNQPNALLVIEQSLAADPDNFDALFFKGIVLQSLRRYEESAGTFSLYQDNRPLDFKTLTFTAKAALGAKDFVLAESIADQILSIVSTHPFGNFVKAVSLFEKNQLNSIAGYLSYSLRDEELRPSSQIIGGLNAFQLSNFELAFDYLEPLIGLFPAGHPINDFILATIFEVGDTRALKKLLKVMGIEEDASSMEVLMNSAVINLAAKGNADAANVAMLTLHKNFPQSSMTSFTTGLLSSMGDLDSEFTADSFEAAIELDPTNVNAYVFLVQNFVTENKFDKAMQIAHQLREHSEHLADNLELYVLLVQQDFANVFIKADTMFDKKTANNITLSIVSNAALLDNQPAKLDYLLTKAKTSELNTTAVLVPAIESKILAQGILNELKKIGSYPYSDQEVIALALNTSKQNELLLDSFSYVLSQPVDSNRIGMLYARALTELGRIPELEAFLNKWSKDSEFESTAVNMLARLLKGQRKNQALKNFLSTVAQEKGLNELLSYDLLNSLINLKLYDDAESLMVKMHSNNIPNDQLAIFEGRLAYSQGDFKGATSKFELAYLTIKTQEVAINLIDSLLKIGKPKSATDFAKQHAEDYPEHYSVKLMLGIMITGAEPENAMALFASVPLRLLMQSAIGLNNYAYLLADEGDIDKARPMIEKAIEIEPDNESFLDTLEFINAKS